MKRPASLCLAAAALIFASCGGGDKSGYSGPAETGAGRDSTVDQRAAPVGVLIEVVDSDYGRVIADSRGEALYLFGKDGPRQSDCYGACAEAWPPAITKGAPRPGKGAKASLLGTTRRADGKLQVTYAGQPLYYYEHDSPGTILCHDVDEFGGPWLVVKPSGEPAA